MKKAIEAKARATALAIFLKYILPFLLAMGFFIGIVFVALMVMDSLTGDNEKDYEYNYDFGGGNVSKEVLKYQPIVEKYADEFGIKDYVPVILGMMMQESGGRGNDPMQSSESLCGRVGCIKDPEVSIKQGVKYVSQQIKNANGDIRLAVQSYNFGGGFINYVLERGGKYSFDLAVEFSRTMYQKLKGTGIYSCVRPNAPSGACYGDVFYVDAVFKYVDVDGTGDNEGSGKWKSPIAGGLRMTSPFGWRSLNGKRELHKGADFGCIDGVTPIHAVDSGKIVYSAYNNGGYGNAVIIQHSKDLYSHYAHMSNRNVIVGQNVKQGQRLGTCGNTGQSFGAHLHLEAKTDMWSGHYDPMKLLRKED